jgi:nicotinate-nucleotide pyrophosphorylase (carboxylating)
LDKRPAENMDLSPFRDARGTVPFSRRSGQFTPQRFPRRENRDSPQSTYSATSLSQNPGNGILCTMVKDFQQTVWDDRLRSDWDKILRLAIAEDLGESGDWTSMALVAEDARGRAVVVARQPGIVAGLPGVALTLAAIDRRLRWLPHSEDGRRVEKGERVGTAEGPARGLLAAERILLNLLGRLSGIASLTRRYVDAVAGTKARIYDTRKTTPGWRRLEKYAVRCGGGWNHRGGLNEAILIKDNHLALGAQSERSTERFTPADAVVRARRFVEDHATDAGMIIEVEVDTLEQLDAVLPARPDIVLLDNMNPLQLREAVARRDAFDRAIELEASGGIALATVRQAAESGVDRISVGALTHSAVALDFGLDWT